MESLYSGPMGAGSRACTPGPPAAARAMPLHTGPPGGARAGARAGSQCLVEPERSQVRASAPPFLLHAPQEVLVPPVHRLARLLGPQGHGEVPDPEAAQGGVHYGHAQVAAPFHALARHHEARVHPPVRVRHVAVCVAHEELERPSPSKGGAPGQPGGVVEERGHVHLELAAQVAHVPVPQEQHGPHLGRGLPHHPA
eukprot:CAMPEP_0206005142 /NCGR_PEP_ID=MMETSP1464-20131121/4401_1 /ASSEMBLY_ACC=CAM_ASM_001124 /TAXON_ID=119497 /ORGANISM="Exanthemachrysis gayraliae, Strain RCC1523" /LENGTH=196 /DNA_ID=CAMNT_0053378569 /DNA_START=232 /DNA_END=819 /DNA_ORIENTATION=-